MPTAAAARRRWLHGGAGAPDWQALPRNTSTPGSGGASIASAPELPVGQHAANRSGGPDYWRATFRRGDEVLVRFGASGAGSVRLCILPPTITDAGSDNAICAKSGTVSAGGTRVVGLIAPSSGRWTLAFDACDSCDLAFHPHDWTDVSYAVTLLVRRYTQVTVHAPSTVRAGSSFTCTGRVAGARAGRIDMERRTAAGRGADRTRADTGGRRVHTADAFCRPISEGDDSAQLQGRCRPSSERDHICDRRSLNRFPRSGRNLALYKPCHCRAFESRGVPARVIPGDRTLAQRSAPPLEARKQPTPRAQRQGTAFIDFLSRVHVAVIGV
jgi:hypothetical protein